MKTQKEAKEYAIAARDWLYVWGANGELITKELMEKLYKTYSSNTYTKEYYQNKLKAGEGKMAADCSGFMHPLSGYDNTANGYYNGCAKKGTIGSIPKDKVCLVFKARSNGTMHHIGIYLGDGTVAEMASSELNYRRRSINATEWTHWGMPKWIDYNAAQEPGWVKDSKGWWYRNADGSWPAGEWKIVNQHWYLFGDDGYMLTGWHRWDGHVVNPADGSGDWYYLEESGDFEGACWHGKAGGKGALERWCV